MTAMSSSAVSLTAEFSLATSFRVTEAVVKSPTAKAWRAELMVATDLAQPGKYAIATSSKQKVQ